MGERCLSDAAVKDVSAIVRRADMSEGCDARQNVVMLEICNSVSSSLSDISQDIRPRLTESTFEFISCKNSWIRGLNHRFSSASTIHCVPNPLTTYPLAVN